MAIGQNFGLYNALFAVGMIAALVVGDRRAAISIALAVAVAGAFGGRTVHPFIFAQLAVALIALALLVTDRRSSPALTLG